MDYKVNTNNWEISIEEIITQPALKNGVVIEKELVTQLTHELKDVDGLLPILQFTLKKIWNEESIKDRKITSSQYNNMAQGKGVSGIIESHAEHVVIKISENGTNKEKESILKSIFVNLVEVNENLSDIKKTVRKDELLKRLKGYEQNLLTEIFEDLVGEESRLLVTSKAKDELINVDIIHEVLIRKWERLRIWINERRDALEYKKRILNDAEYNKRHNSGFYKGRKLREAKNWSKNNSDLTSDLSNKFIENSIKKIKQIRETIFAILVVVVISVVILYKPYQRSSFRDAIQNNPSLRAQLEGAGGNIDSITTLTINAANEQILRGNISFFTGLKHVNITNSNLENLSILNGINLIKSLSIVDNPNLQNIEGVEKLDSLKSLEIRHNISLNSLSGIKNIKSLNFLVISDNSNLATLHGIENLKFLRTLEINNNNITTLEWINELPSLSDLQISGGRFLRKDLFDLKGIDKLKSIRVLELHNIKIKNFKGIEQIPSLYRLEITISDSLLNLQWISKLETLRSLKISSTMVSKPTSEKQINLERLKSLKFLTYLEIDGLNLTSLKAIENFDSLKILSLVSLNSLTDLHSIKLKSLTDLQLFNCNNLTDLGEIKQLKFLTNLRLTNCNNLTDLGAIKQLKSLTKLALEYCRSLTGFDEIKQLHSLKHLVIKGTSIKTINGVQKLKNLTFLQISENGKLTSLEGIEQLKSLTSLEINDNPNITTLQWIDQLSSLTSLSITENGNLTHDWISTMKLQGIHRLKSLTSLMVTHNYYLTSLQIISPLKSLTSLSLADDPNLTTIQGIEQLQSLASLSIRAENSFIDLNTLYEYELKALKRLDISKNIVINYKKLSKKNPQVKLIRY